MAFLRLLAHRSRPFVTNYAVTNVISSGAATTFQEFAGSPDGATVYVADERAYDGTQKGGIQRWDTNTVSGGYTYAYTLRSFSGGTNGARGLTVDWSANPIWGAGVTGAILYATTAAPQTNSLVKITDTGSASAPLTLVTAGLNQLLRGVRFGPGSSSSDNCVCARGQNRRHRFECCFHNRCERRRALYLSMVQRRDAIE